MLSFRTFTVLGLTDRFTGIEAPCQSLNVSYTDRGGEVLRIGPFSTFKNRMKQGTFEVLLK